MSVVRMILLLPWGCVYRVDVISRWGSKSKTINTELRFVLAALSGMMVAGECLGWFGKRRLCRFIDFRVVMFFAYRQHLSAGLFVRGTGLVISVGCNCVMVGAVLFARRPVVNVRFTRSVLCASCAQNRANCDL